MVTATANQLANFEHMIQLIEYYSLNPSLGYQHNDENKDLISITTNTTMNNMVNVMET